MCMYRLGKTLSLLAVNRDEKMTQQVRALEARESMQQQHIKFVIVSLTNLRETNRFRLHRRPSSAQKL